MAGRLTHQSSSSKVEVSMPGKRIPLLVKLVLRAQNYCLLMQGIACMCGPLSCTFWALLAGRLIRLLSHGEKQSHHTESTSRSGEGLTGAIQFDPNFIHTALPIVRWSRHLQPSQAGFLSLGHAAYIPPEHIGREQKSSQGKREKVVKAVAVRTSSRKASCER